MESDYPSEAKIFRAFCDEKRLHILDLLQGGEKCVCALIEEIGLPQSTLSYHMKILCESGVVVGREEGKWTHYSINENGIMEAIELLKELTSLQAKHKSSDCCAVI